MPLQKTSNFRPFRLAIIAAIVIAFLLGSYLVPIYTDWLWFIEVGYPGVFGTILLTRWTLFAVFGALFFIITYSNLWFALRQASQGNLRLTVDDPLRQRFGAAARKITGWMVLAGCVFVSFMVGSEASTHYMEFLQFIHGAPFHETDPLFHKDIGFYVFRLPLFNYLYNWFFFTLIFTTIATAAIYYLNRAIEFIDQSIPTIAPYVSRHLLVLLGVLAIIFGIGYQLACYELLYSNNQIYYGAGYTDIHARLLAYHAQMVTAILVGLLCFVNLRIGKPFRLPLLGAGVWAFCAVVLGGIYPTFMQNFTVVPNQFNKERLYISRDLDYTRQGYGLNHVVQMNFPADNNLTYADLQKNTPTVHNIRLWDWQELTSIYTQNEAIKQYYKFDYTLPDGSMESNIDVDRYHINGKYRQVMIAPRELSLSALPSGAQTWQNRHLEYTHGYGVVMTPVNVVLPGGNPDYYIDDIPPTATFPLPKTHWQVYYGQLTNHYVFVDSTQLEFDYPAGTTNKYNRYHGTGGVPIGSWLKRMAFSLRLGDANMLLTSDFTPQTRIMFRRNIIQRVHAIAPFLSLDSHPYIVVEGGRLTWIIDAYTMSNRFPYSKPTSLPIGPMQTLNFNYIRNSVKITVDAYNGTTRFYVADPKDPIIQTYERIFPHLFRPLSDMPAGLIPHLRYPEDIFRFQRRIYATYHITDPQVYYSKEDIWAIPSDPTGSNASDQGPSTMSPYYIIMRLPGEKHEEFLLLTLFTPVDKENQNIIGWMCAKCDPEDYGQLVLYRFPKSRVVMGPAQAVAYFNQQSDISKQLSLWRGGGSNANFGNLLVIPIKTSLLYVAPLYLQSVQSATKIPQLQRVLVATGDPPQIAMKPTLDAALGAIYGVSGSSIAAGPSSTSVPPSGTTATANAPAAAPAAQIVNKAYQSILQVEKAQQATVSALKQLEQNLQQLKSSLQPQPSPTAPTPPVKKSRPALKGAGRAAPP